MSARPPLPGSLNPHLRVLSGDVPPVKYQILNCQGQDILVGRMKIETPTSTGHAFILRRYDTGAVSATTMFRAAFPTASEQQEKEELQWIKDTYDLSGNNGSSRDAHITRLAGVWVDTDVALILAKHYSLGPLIKGVADATPDPNGSYRRSANKSGSGATPKGPDPVVSTAPIPLKPVSTNNTTRSSKEPPTKRRKAVSPAPRSVSPSTKSVTPPPRRSTRMKSPSVRSVTVEPLKTLRTPKKPMSRRTAVDTPGGSEQTVVDEDAEGLEKVINSELHSEDVAEQKEMIQGLKAQRALVEGDIDMDDRKRSREDGTLRFNPKAPETEPRVIATNRRVSTFDMQPKNKAAAWGAAAFVFGAAAITLLPNLF